MEYSFHISVSTAITITCAMSIISDKTYGYTARALYPLHWESPESFPAPWAIKAILSLVAAMQMH
jgi:hypothetical protein|tara:strand:- start:353 stop:547 length:195 start_codon:yes stop_codon:yes gene_type:complete